MKIEHLIVLLLVILVLVVGSGFYVVIQELRDIFQVLRELYFYFNK